MPFVVPYWIVRGGTTASISSAPSSMLRPTRPKEGRENEPEPDGPRTSRLQAPCDLRGDRYLSRGSGYGGERG